MPKLHFKDWNLIAYEEALQKQEEILQQVIAEKLRYRDREPGDTTLLPPENHLIFCEHPHVYTLGNKGGEEHLLLSKQELEEKGISYYPTRRGGDITYHGPGQLVGYPILDLDQFFTDIHKYLRYIEEVIIKTIRSYGIEGGRIDGLTGVWVDFNTPEKARKIAAIGVRCSRWVTMHGFALNVNSDLDFFKNIVPCGIADKGVTSIAQETGIPVNMISLKSILKENFISQFGAELVDLPMSF